MGQRLKYTDLQTRNAGGQQAHKKLLIKKKKLLITDNGQRNAKQNYNEVAPHTGHSGHH